MVSVVIEVARSQGRTMLVGTHATRRVLRQWTPFSFLQSWPSYVKKIRGYIPPANNANGHDVPNSMGSIKYVGIACKAQVVNLQNNGYSCIYLVRPVVLPTFVARSPPPPYPTKICPRRL